jgi:hypothetical protein
MAGNAAKDIVGSPVGVSIGGYAFRVDSGADFKDAKPEFKNTEELTSGEPLRKMETISREVESVTLKVNDEEAEMLKAFNDQPDSLKLSYTLRSGSTYQGEGWIEYEGRQTATGKAEVKLHSPGGWTYFGG